MSFSPGTVRVHCVYKCPPERLYKAFLDPEAIVKGLPPHCFTGKVHHMDARVGGGYKMSFTNFSTGHSHSFGATFDKMTPHERLRDTDKFDAPGPLGEMHVTVEFRNVLGGTELNVAQEGIPATTPVEFCYLGGQDSLPLLSHVTEPEIPDGA